MYCLPIFIHLSPTVYSQELYILTLRFIYFEEAIEIILNNYNHNSVDRNCDHDQDCTVNTHVIVTKIGVNVGIGFKSTHK